MKRIFKKILFFVDSPRSSNLFNLYVSLSNLLILFLSCDFLIFFFDNKKPTLIGKPESPPLTLKKAARFPDSMRLPFVRIFSKLPKPRIISFLSNVYIFFFNVSKNRIYLVNSLLTVSFFLPLALRLARTFLPSLLFILSLKPCLFLRLVLLG